MRHKIAENVLPSGAVLSIYHNEGLKRFELDTPLGNTYESTLKSLIYQLIFTLGQDSDTKSVIDSDCWDIDIEFYEEFCRYLRSAVDTGAAYTMNIIAVVLARQDDECHAIPLRAPAELGDMGIPIEFKRYCYEGVLAKNTISGITAFAATPSQALAALAMSDDTIPHGENKKDDASHRYPEDDPGSTGEDSCQ